MQTIGIIGNCAIIDFFSQMIEKIELAKMEIAFKYFDKRASDFAEQLQNQLTELDVLICGPTDSAQISLHFDSLPPIVSIFPALTDIMRAVADAAEKDGRVCILSPFDLEKFHNIKHALRTDWSIVQYKYSSELPMAHYLARIASEGFISVVGGFGVNSEAGKYGLTPYLYYSHETLMRPLNEAIQLTNVKRAQMELNNNLKRIIDVSDVGLVVVSDDFTIIYINKLAEDIMGVHFPDLVGKSLTNFISFVDGDLKHKKINVTTINGHEILCDCVPLSDEQTVYRLKEVDKVEQASYEVRKRILGKNNTAKYFFTDIVGSGLQNTIELARTYAISSDANVLITGPTGCGKELFAASLHNSSRRAKENFVAINCAALPETLLESELFGYEPGAFTGAHKQGKRGLVELAHKGTLFLDEVAEIPYALQAKLLRVLQEQEVLHVGGEELLPIDIRVIAATNRNLEDEIEAKRFRSDLYYRLSTLILEIPPLANRPSDCFELIEHFLSKRVLPREYKNAIKRAIYICFKNYSWPGNARELQNVLERALTFVSYYSRKESSADRLTEGLVSILTTSSISKVLSPKHSKSSVKQALSVQDIHDALRNCNGNRSKASKMLGISRSTLWRKLK